MIQLWLDQARWHAPHLAIGAPLVGAALALLMPERRVSWVVAVLATTFAAGVASDWAWRVFSGAPAPIARGAIALRADGVAAFAAPLIASVGALTVIASAPLLRGYAPERVAPFTLVLICGVIAGWQAALFASDYAALILSVETAWLASVGVVGLVGDRNRASLSGALRMLIAGAIAGSLLIVGAGLLYRSLGSLDQNALGGAQIATPTLAAAGIGLVLAALGVKAGIAPLHAWVGAVYGRAPGAAALVLAGVGGIGALALIARTASIAEAAPGIGAGVTAALCAIGVGSVLICSLQAIGARNVRRLFACGCAAQAGCVLVSLSLGSTAGLAAALVQVFALAAAALALFGGAAVLSPAPALSELDGLARRAPLSSAAIALGVLSLIGAPLTVGFLGRWRLIEAGVGAGWWWAAGAVIVASLAAVFYGGRVIERLYFRRAETVSSSDRDAWRFAVMPALIAGIASILIGVAPAALLRAADIAGGAMIETPP